MCSEAEYINDTLLDEYYDDVDNFGNDSENDYEFITSLRYYQDCGKRKPINYDKIFTKMSNDDWNNFKLQLKPSFNNTFLIRRFNGNGNYPCVIVHETDKAVLICEYDLETETKLNNKFWVPKSVMYYRNTEKQAMIMYIPNWFTKKNIQ